MLQKKKKKEYYNRRRVFPVFYQENECYKSQILHKNMASLPAVKHIANVF